MSGNFDKVLNFLVWCFCVRKICTDVYVLILQFKKVLLSSFYENFYYLTAFVEIKVFVIFIIQMCLVFDRML